MMRSPSHSPTFRAHKHAHEEVVDNEHWYGDGKPSFGKAFSAKKTADRQNTIIEILERAAKRAAKAGNSKLAKAYTDLADRLYYCRSRHRCGSLACPKCARAFQKAKVSAERVLIKALAKSPDKTLVFVTLIPMGMMFAPGNFSQIEITKANRWLKDMLEKTGIDRVIFGSADLGWARRRGGNYIQLHWHLALWTTNPDGLKAKLIDVFLPIHKYEQPVDVTVTWDLKFLPYMNKKIKLPDLLRRARRQLPELSLVLDRTDPLDLMVIKKLRLSAQGGVLTLQ
jgi:hypothetical protein